MTFDSDRHDAQVSMLQLCERLRGLGVESDIQLPQIVVCGEQSSGKSSALRSLSGVPFPVDSGLCTRHPTRLVLRNCDESFPAQIKASIQPDHASASPTEIRHLQDFTFETDNVTDLNRLFEDARHIMGLTDAVGNFSRHTLQIECYTHNSPNITVVDLPGLFQAGDDKKQSDEDKVAVDEMVLKIITQPRTIVLVIASAAVAPQNQSVLSFLRTNNARSGPDGHPKLDMVGVITKADLLSSSGQRSSDYQFYQSMLKGDDMPISRGWHVLMNFSEHDDDDSVESLMAQRRRELEFFNGPDWTDTQEEVKGIASLEIRLCELQYQHIKDSLPGLITDAHGASRRLTKELSQMESSAGQTTDARETLLIFSEHVRRNPVPTGLRTKVDQTTNLFKQELNQLTKGVFGYNGRGSLQANVNPECRSKLIQEAKELLEEFTQFPGGTSVRAITTLFYRHSSGWTIAVDKLVNRVSALIGETMEDVLKSSPKFAGMQEGFNSHILPILVQSFRRDAETRTKDILSGHHDKDTLELSRRVMQKAVDTRIDNLKRLLSQELLGFDGLLPMDLDTSNASSDAFRMGQISEALVKIGPRHVEESAQLETVACMVAHYEVELEKLVEILSTSKLLGSIRIVLTRFFSNENILRLDRNTVGGLCCFDQEKEDQRQRLVRRCAALDDAIEILEEKCRGLFGKRRRSSEDGSDAVMSNSGEGWNRANGKDEKKKKKKKLRHSSSNE